MTPQHRAMLAWHPTATLTPETAIRGVLWLLYVYGGQYARDLKEAADA